MKRVREIIDRIVFAGLKPRQRNAPSGNANAPDGDGGFLDRLLSGGAPKDPLYLSNRTTSQKVISASLWTLPFLLVGIGLYLWATGYFKETAPRAMVQKKVDLIPELKDVRIDTVQPLMVTSLVIKHSPSSVLEGVMRNNTPRALRGIDVIFDLVDQRGSALGSVSVHVEKLDGDAITTFKVPIKPRGAYSAIFRESSSR